MRWAAAREEEVKNEYSRYTVGAEKKKLKIHNLFTVHSLVRDAEEL